MKNILFIFVIVAFAQAADTQRYVDSASTGGNGTTAALSGTNAAYNSLDAALDEYVAATVTDRWIIDLNGTQRVDPLTQSFDIGNPTGASKTNYLIIRNGASYRHSGIYSTSLPRIEHSADWIMFTITNPRTVFDGLQIKSIKASKSGAYGIYRGVAGNDSIKNCIIVGELSGTSSQDHGIFYNVAGDTLILDNNVIYGFVNSTEANYAINCNYSTNIYNNTIYNSYRGFSTSGSEPCTLKNNVIFNCPGATINDWSTICFIDYNATDDAQGTHAVALDTNSSGKWDASFVGYSSNPPNFNIKDASAPIYNTGTTGISATDITGAARAQNDIGAFGYNAPACTDPVIPNTLVNDTLGKNGYYASGGTLNDFDSMRIVSDGTDSVVMVHSLVSDSSHYWVQDTGRVNLQKMWYGCDDSGLVYDTLHGILSPLVLDSVSWHGVLADTVHPGDTVVYHGRKSYRSIDSVTMDTVKADTVATSDTTVAAIVPAVGVSGWITPIWEDEYGSDTASDSFFVANVSTAYTLTMASSGSHSKTKPAIGAYSYDSATVVAIGDTCDPGYRHIKWMVTGGSSHFNPDSSLDTMFESHELTDSCRIVQYSLTMVGTHSVTVPAAGVSQQDSGLEIPISRASTSTGWCPGGWTGTGGVFNGDSTTFTITGTATVTAVDTGCLQIAYNGNGNVSGSAPADAEYYAPGELITTKANRWNLAKPGYLFRTWNTAANGSGTTRAPGGTWAIGSTAATLYAQYDTLPAKFGDTYWTFSNWHKFVWYLDEPHFVNFFDLKNLPVIVWSHLKTNCQIVITDSTGARLPSICKMVDSADRSGYVIFDGVNDASEDVPYRMYWDSMATSDSAAVTASGHYMFYTYDDSMAPGYDEAKNYSLGTVTADAGISSLRPFNSGWGNSIYCTTGKNHIIENVTQLEGATKAYFSIKCRLDKLVPFENRCLFCVSDSTNHYVFTGIIGEDSALIVYVGSASNYFKIPKFYSNVYGRDSLWISTEIAFDGGLTGNNYRLEVLNGQNMRSGAYTGTIPTTLPSGKPLTLIIGSLLDGSLPAKAYYDNFTVKNSFYTFNNIIAGASSEGAKYAGTVSQSASYRTNFLHKIVFNSDSANIGKIKPITFSGLSSPQVWIDRAINDTGYVRIGSTGNTGTYNWRVVGTNEQLTRFRFVDQSDTSIRLYSNSMRIYYGDLHNVIMAHFNGANGAKSISEPTGHTLTSVGSATVSNIRKFGSGSGSFDSTNYFISNHSDPFHYKGNSWMIDFWIKFKSMAHLNGSIWGSFKNYKITNEIQDSCNLGILQIVDRIMIYQPQASDIQGYCPTITTDTLTGLDTGWHHIAIGVDYYKDNGGTVAGDGQTYAFFDGDSVGSGMSDYLYDGQNSWDEYQKHEITFGKYNGRLTVITGDDTAYAYEIPGVSAYIDEFRYSKDTIRWTASFTPPDSEYYYSKNSSVARKKRSFSIPSFLIGSFVKSWKD
jgi:parallel beta-helix repeat protein